MLVDYLMFNSILKGSRLWCLWSKLEEPLLRPFALEPLFLWLSTKPWVWSARPLVPFVLTLLRTLNTCTGIVRSLTRKGSTGRWPWKMARLAGNKQHVPIGAPGWGQGTNAKVVGGPSGGFPLQCGPAAAAAAGGRIALLLRSAPAALASLLFHPLEPQIIGKNTVFRDFPTFSGTWIFFLLRLSLLWSSLFCSSLLYSSAPPLLFICPYRRKFDF